MRRTDQSAPAGLNPIFHMVWALLNGRAVSCHHSDTVLALRFLPTVSCGAHAAQGPFFTANLSALTRSLQFAAACRWFTVGLQLAYIRLRRMLADCLSCHFL